MSKKTLFTNALVKIFAAIFFTIAVSHTASAANYKYLFEIKSNQDGPGALNQPADVALDENGDIYVADTANSRIVVFDGSGKTKRVFGKEGSGEGELKYPMALAVDNANKIVYVADSSNYRIQAFKADGVFLSSIDLNKGIEEEAKKIRPIGIAVAVNGNVYVADADNNYIRVYSPAGKYLFKFGGFGEEEGQLCVPVGLFIDKQDKLYAIDMNNSRLQIFDAEGKFLLRIGSLGDTKGNFFKPKDVCVSQNGFIFVSDAGNSVVQVFDKKGKFIDIIGADKDPELQLAYPFGVAVANNRIYIADRLRSSIRVYQIQYN